MYTQTHHLLFKRNTHFKKKDTENNSQVWCNVLKYELNKNLINIRMAKLFITKVI